MHKFVYENDYEGQLNTKIEFTIPSDASLTDMLEQFQYYLKGVGFHIDGNIDIVPEHSFDDTVRFDEYGNYGENNPPVGDSPVFEKGYPSYDAVNRDYRDVKITYSGEPVYTGPYQK